MIDTDPITLELEAQIAMGNQSAQFIKTELGRYIVARSEHEESEAKNYLADVDPTNQSEIIKYQNQISVARGIRSYFGELIKDGIQAEQTIDTPEE